MDIKFLLKKAMINWQGSENELRKDFENILKLISTLPEPKNMEIKYDSYALLALDEENKQAQKEDIIKESMFEIG